MASLAYPNESSASPAAPLGFGVWGFPHLLYQNLYIAFVTLSLIDVAVTWGILCVSADGRELNPIAAAMVLKYDLLGLIAYKYALTVWNVMMIETVGRRRYRTGYRLAQVAVGIAAFPIFFAAWQVLMYYDLL